jgi:hypothetical protein
MKARSGLYYALTEALIPPEEPAIPHGVEEALVRAAAFAQEQVGRLPWRLLLLMRVGLTVFRAAVRLRYFRGYCELPLAERRRVVSWWAYGPFSLTRQLFRPIRSTALLAYYEYAAVRSESTGR